MRKFILFACLLVTSSAMASPTAPTLIERYLSACPQTSTRAEGHVLVVPYEKAWALGVRRLTETLAGSMLDVRTADSLTGLASGDPLQIGAVLRNFSPFGGRLLNAFLKQPDSKKEFRSLYTMAETGLSFSPVVVEVPSLLGTDPVADQISGKDINALRSQIVAMRTVESSSLGPVILVEMKTSENFLVLALRLVKGCEDYSRQYAGRAWLGFISENAPKQYVFQSPVSSFLRFGFFFGNRILGSLAALEDHHLPKFGQATWQFHSGVDFDAKIGTPVRAVYNGTVFLAADLGCQGNTVILEHEIEGFQTPIFSVYAHLNGFTHFLRNGVRVKQGQVIAFSGASGTPLHVGAGMKSGCVEGPHLHFEIRAPVNQAAVPGDSRNAERAKDSLYSETLPLNPADFIREVDEACKTEKEKEIAIAEKLERSRTRAIPPMTAGLCSARSEKSWGWLPKVYKIHTEREFISMFGPKNFGGVSKGR